jgi:hypothetical protein
MLIGLNVKSRHKLGLFKGYFQPVTPVVNKISFFYVESFSPIKVLIEGDLDPRTLRPQNI